MEQKNYHESLREKIVEHMEKKEDTYSPYVDSAYDVHIENTKKKSGGQEIWGTEADITAAAHFLNINIEEYSINNGDTTKQVFSNDSDTSLISI